MAMFQAENLAYDKFNVYSGLFSENTKMNTQSGVYSGILYGGKVFSEFGESSVISQTKAIQISTFYKCLINNL